MRRVGSVGCGRHIFFLRVNYKAFNGGLNLAKGITMFCHLVEIHARSRYFDKNYRSLFWRIINMMHYIINGVVTAFCLTYHYLHGVKKDYFSSIHGDGRIVRYDEDYNLVIMLRVFDYLPGSQEAFVKLCNSIKRHYGPVTVIRN